MNKPFLYILLTLFIFLGCSKKEKSIFILPEDYTGIVVIIYDNANGLEKKYENDGVRVYEIPNTGILKTKFEADYGWSDFPSFYYENSNSQQLPHYYDFDKIPDGEIVSYGGTSGTVNKDLEGKSTVKFSQYYVGNKEDIEKAIQNANSLDYIKLSE